MDGLARSTRRRLSPVQLPFTGGRNTRPSGTNLTYASASRILPASRGDGSLEEQDGVVEAMLADHAQLNARSAGHDNHACGRLQVDGPWVSAPAHACRISPPARPRPAGSRETCTHRIVHIGALQSSSGVATNSAPIESANLRPRSAVRSVHAVTCSQCSCKPARVLPLWRRCR